MKKMKREKEITSRKQSKVKKGIFVRKKIRNEKRKETLLNNNDGVDPMIGNTHSTRRL